MVAGGSMGLRGGGRGGGHWDGLGGGRHRRFIVKIHGLLNTRGG